MRKPSYAAREQTCRSLSSERASLRPLLNSHRQWLLPGMAMRRRLNPETAPRGLRRTSLLQLVKAGCRFSKRRSRWPAGTER